MWAEEFVPLQRDQHARLDDGTLVTDWAEDLVVEDADVVLRHVDGPLAGRPAVTRRAAGGGAWYVSAMLDQDGVQRIVDRVVEERAVPRTVTAPPGLEAVRRVRDDGSGVLFLLNHRDDDVTVVASGTDLLDGSGQGRRPSCPPAACACCSRRRPHDRRERDLAHARLPERTVHVLRGGGVGLVLATRPDGLPEVLHWGRDTGRCRRRTRRTSCSRRTVRSRRAPTTPRGR